MGSTSTCLSQAELCSFTFLLLLKGFVEAFLTRVQGQRPVWGHHYVHCEASKMIFEKKKIYLHI